MKAKLIAPQSVLNTLLFAGIVSAAIVGSAHSQRPQPIQQEPLVVKAARVIGIKQCLAGISGTASRIMQGARRQDILVDWDHENPDQGALFSLTGLEFPNGQTSAVALNAVPVGNGRCTLLAERISVAAKACSTVAQQDLKGMNATQLLPSMTVYTRPGQTLESYSLITTDPTHCLVIRRQAVFNWSGA